MSMFESLLAQGMLNGCVYALVGIGLSLTYGKQNLIDIANPAFIIVGSYLILALTQLTGLDPFLIAPLGLIALFGIGCIVQVVVIRPLLRRPDFEIHVQSALILFGLALFIQTALGIIFSADPQGVRTPYSDDVIRILGLRLPLLKLIAVALALTCTLSLYLFLNKTFFGRAILATYTNREAAQLLAINVKLVDIVTYGLGTALSGIAGLLIALSYSFSSASVQQWTVIAFAVVVIGGKGSVVGVLLAGLTVGLVEAVVSSVLSASWIYFAVYALLLFVFVVRPTGILGERT